MRGEGRERASDHRGTIEAGMPSDSGWRRTLGRLGGRHARDGSGPGERSSQVPAWPWKVAPHGSSAPPRRMSSTAEG